MNKSFWQGLNRELGFYEDERTEHVRGLAKRNAYLVLVSAMLAVALYLELGQGSRGTLWVAGLLGWLSLLFLMGRRWQLAGRDGLDERAREQMNHSFMGGYLIVSLGILLYGLWLLVASAEGQVSQLWNLPIFLSLFAILGTQLSHNTILGHPALWLGMVLINGGMLLWVGGMLAMSLLQEQLAGQRLPEPSVVLGLLLALTPFIGLNLIFILAAWRSWQNERGGTARGRVREWNYE